MPEKLQVLEVPRGGAAVRLRVPRDDKGRDGVEQRLDCHFFHRRLCRSSRCVLALHVHRDVREPGAVRRCGWAGARQVAVDANAGMVRRQRLGRRAVMKDSHRRRMDIVVEPLLVRVDDAPAVRDDHAPGPPRGVVALVRLDPREARPCRMPTAEDEN